MPTPKTRLSVWYEKESVELAFEPKEKTSNFQADAVKELRLDGSCILSHHLVTTSNVSLDPHKTLEANSVEGGDCLLLVDNYEQLPADKYWAASLFAYTVFLLAVALIAFVEVWPGTTAELTPTAARSITFYFLIFRLGTFTVQPEVLLLCVVILSGIIGACVWSMYALAKHVGASHDFNRLWAAWYLSRPMIGAGLAVVLYAVIRAGLFSAGATVSDTDVIGVSAISFITGLFSENAIYKLHQIADTLLGNPPDTKAPKSPQKSS